MLRYVAAVAAVAVGATAVYAQNVESIKARQALMKSNAAASREAGAMLKGEAPFDLAKIQTSLKSFQDNAGKFKALFPDNSKTGTDTRALPAVWEKRAAFEAAVDKFGADAKAAAAEIKDEASFKANWGKVASNCGGCHKEFQAPPK